MITNNEILIDRAKLLAVDNFVEEVNIGKILHVVEFLLLPERYGIESHFISEVILLKELTPIPGVPSFVSGVTNVRGKIVSIVNLKTFLGLVTKGITELNKTILINYNGMEFGIIADAIIGIRSVDEKTLSPAPVTIQSDSAKFVKGITPDGMIILDGVHLLSETTIVVNQK